MYFSVLSKPVKGKMLHIVRFRSCQNKLCHPGSNNRRELEAVTAETKRAIQPFISWQCVEDWMKVGCIVIYTGPSSTWYGSSQRGNATSSHCSEVRDLLLGQSLRIIIRIAWGKDIFCRADQCYSTNIWPQVNVARQI